MRFTLFLICITYSFWGCRSLKTDPDQKNPSIIYSEGIQPYSLNSNPVSPTANLGLAKLYKGNMASGAGIFISDNGLFLTNYSAIIDFIASGNNPDFMRNGFIANETEQEIKLEGVSLLIEVEQTDVSEKVQKAVTELSPNHEIYRSIEEQKTHLIQERRGDRNDLFIEIKDLYSGNRHIMVVYQIVQDIRLVFAPSISVDLHSSDELQSNLMNEYAILRAYSPSNSQTAFNPGHHFPLQEFIPEQYTELMAIGFPGSTYRLETARAINFYHTKLNPYIISFFDIYLQKEDSLAAINDLYALRSLANRYSIKQNLTFFQTAQEMISGQNVINVKKKKEEQLFTVIEADTTLPDSYSNLYLYIDQAYDIAEQTADILYAANYFNSLSSLDNLASVFQNYLNETSATDATDQLIQTTLSTHNQMLQQINVGAELNMLKKFIPVFKSVPEDQQPLMLFDLFSGEASDNIQKLSSDYVDNVLASSFLFDGEKAKQILENGTLNSDPLFNFLEEIAFSFQTAQQNFLRHYAFSYPAQQVITRVQINIDSSENIMPDADSFLAFNIGSLHSQNQVNSDFFLTTHDFSGKTPGTAIVSPDGKLIGMVVEETNASVLGNYIYTRESSFLKALNISTIIEEVSSAGGTEKLVEEMTGEN